MPQVSLYFDSQLAQVISEKANKNHLSVSRYVSNILYQHIGDEWPDQFLAVLGSLSDGDLQRPEQLEFSEDSPRATF